MLLEMRNIHKSFGSIKAVDGVDFKADYGEVIALVGDNGAGKSTLIKILAGIYRPDQGEIFFEGKKIKMYSTRDAQQYGIETLFQDQALVDCVGVSRNIFMGREKTRIFGFLDLKDMNQKSMGILNSMKFSIKSAATDVELLSGGERQGVAIARAFYFKAKLLNMDEPTIALSVAGVHRVLEHVQSLKDQKVTVIFITHNLYHAYPIADKFVLMKRGKVIYETKKKDTSVDQLSAMITSE
jgi:simple sugar transport system ATP-binding protein